MTSAPRCCFPALTAVSWGQGCQRTQLKRGCLAEASRPLSLLCCYWRVAAYATVHLLQRCLFSLCGQNKKADRRKKSGSFFKKKKNASLNLGLLTISASFFVANAALQAAVSPHFPPLTSVSGGQTETNKLFQLFWFITGKWSSSLYLVTRKSWKLMMDRIFDFSIHTWMRCSVSWVLWRNSISGFFSRRCAFCFFSFRVQISLLSIFCWGRLSAEGSEGD